MVGFHGKPLYVCGSDLQTGSQVLRVQDNICRPGNAGRSPLLYCTLTLIVMQGHQKNSKNKNNVVHLSSNRVVIIYCYIGCKDKVTTWHLNGFPEDSNIGSAV